MPSCEAIPGPILTSAQTVWNYLTILLTSGVISGSLDLISFANTLDQAVPMSQVSTTHSRS